MIRLFLWAYYGFGNSYLLAPGIIGKTFCKGGFEILNVIDPKGCLWHERSAAIPCLYCSNGDYFASS